MPRYVLAIALALTVATPARADKMTDAEELFRHGKALMSDGKSAEACPLFEESERLDPQMGTLLNLAICHETIGKTATAWGEFRAVEQQARAAGREDRVKLAREHTAKLEPRLSRLKIVPNEARPAGLAVRVDGEAKGEALWSGVAVDPGTRTVEVTAPGKKPATLKVKVDDEGTTVTVPLPVLEDAPPPPPGIGPPPTSDGDRGSRRSIGLVVAGVGVAAALAGGAFGVLAIVKNGDATKACPHPCIDGSEAARTADADTDRALFDANVANVAVPIGAIAVAVGAYLILTSRPTSEGGALTPARAFVAPSRRGAGVGVAW